MSNIIRRNTVGMARKLDSSLDKKIGSVRGGLNYVVDSTKGKLARTFDNAFGDKSIKQLGKEIKPKQQKDFRLYTNSLNPSIQLHKGRINMSVGVLQKQINDGYTGEDKIGVGMGDDGVLRYVIRTDKGVKRVTLDQMNSETREWVGERVSDAIDNASKTYAQKAKLAGLMGGKSLSFSYINKNGKSRTIRLGSDRMYDILTDAHKQLGHPYHAFSAQMSQLKPQFEDAFAKKFIGPSAQGPDAYNAVINAQVKSLKTKDINAYSNVHKGDFGVSAVRNGVDFKDLFDGAVQASEQEGIEGKEGSEESSQTPETVIINPQEQMIDYIDHPQNHAYDDVIHQLDMWNIKGLITDEKMTQMKAIADRFNQNGKFAVSENGADMISLSQRQMDAYLSNSRNYSRSEVENYLAQFGASGSISEDLYDEYLEKIDNAAFIDHNIAATAA